MSAFIVSADTIDLIISGAIQANVTNERFVLKANARGALTGITWLSTREDANYLGRILWAENHHSVNVRYEESTEMPAYTFQPVDLTTMADWRAVALKSLRCLNYQACEAADYHETNAYRLVEWITELLDTSDKSPAYQAAPWGWERSSVIPEPEPPPAPKAYTTATQDAASVRAALKAKGWTSRDVSVRAHNYSMGSSLYVTIKNPAVPINAVEAITNRAESIDRDQWGEILSGGNRFVHVSYDSDTLKAMGVQWLSAIDAAYLVLTAASDNSLIPIEGTAFLLGRDHCGFAIWGESGHLMNCYDLESAAQTVAVRMVA